MYTEKRRKETHTFGTLLNVHFFQEAPPGTRDDHYMKHMSLACRQKAAATLKGDGPSNSKKNHSKEEDPGPFKKKKNRKGLVNKKEWEKNLFSFSQKSLRVFFKPMKSLLKRLAGPGSKARFNGPFPRDRNSRPGVSLEYLSILREGARGWRPVVLTYWRLDWNEWRDLDVTRAWVFSSFCSFISFFE